MPTEISLVHPLFISKDPVEARIMTPYFPLGLMYLGAVLREKDSGKRYKLHVGDQLGRMQVVEIAAKDVVFRIEDFGYERQETLSLRKQEDLTP